MKSPGRQVRANYQKREMKLGFAGVFLLVLLLFVLGREMHAADTGFLSAEEKSWLAAHPVIRLAPDPDYPPIEYFDGSGAYSGLAADYVALLQEKLGIRFQIVRLQSWQEVLEKTRAGEVDVWGAATQNAQRSEYMQFTEPYVEFPSVIIVRENVTESLSLEKLYGMDVAAVSGYADGDYIRSRYPGLLLGEVPTVETGLKKVSFGMVDAFVTNLAAATYGIEKTGITNLRLAGDIGYLHRLGFGVRKDWPELTSILQKTLAQIGPAQRTTVFRRWVGLDQPGILGKRAFWLSLLAGVGTLALIFAGLLAWNRSLKSQVEQRTAELTAELKVRKKAEKALELAHWELELRVEDRTAELTKTNIALQAQIAQREQVEEALVQSEQRYREVFEYASDGIFLLDVTSDGRFLCVDFNPAAEAMTGRTNAEVSGKCLEELFPRELADRIIANFRRCLDAGVPISYEETIDFTGRRMVFYTSLIPLKDATGRIYRLLGVAHDITDRKRAEEELRALTERLALATGIADMGVWDHDTGGSRTTWNDRMFEIYGIPRKDTVKFRDWVTAVLPEDRPVLKASLRQMTAKPSLECLEFRIIRNDGSLRHIQAAARAFADEKGNLARVVGFNIDITERKRVEEALRRSEERYRRLFNSFNDGVVVYEGPVDHKPGKFVEVNDRACKMSGYTREELLDMSLVDIVKDPGTLEVLPSLMDQLLAEGRAVGEVDYITRDGSKLPIEVTNHLFQLDGRPMVLACARDISERRKAENERDRLEEQLRHAQKMEAIGTLAGGIAHDFNNILGAIIGYTEIMLGDVSTPGDMRSSLNLVLKAAMRARDLVRQILVFSRMKGMGERLPVDVGEIVKETIDFLRATLPASIEIRLQLAADSAEILADPTQIQQVLVNLCTNAAHAMEDSGGVLNLALDATAFSEETVIAHTLLKPGPYLVLSVRDTGTGMGAETLERIFDPYFTTKEVGKGSGLGLAVVRGVIERHEGAVTVSSEPGKGTTFQVYLPRTMDVSAPRSIEAGSLPRGTERILFVDDEESLVAVAEGMLTMLGYQVEGTTDCVKAMEWFYAAPDRYDLVITDYTMPRMNGVDFAARLMKVRPNIPVILCTGFSERTNERNLRGTGIRAFAMKPLSLRETAELVRKALDG